MLSAYRRSGLVTLLLILVSATCLAARPATKAAILPSIPPLIAGTSWRVGSNLVTGSWPGEVYGAWGLYDGHGSQAQLFVGAATAISKVVHWSGELGYEGEGYQVLSRSEQNIQLRDGRIVPIIVATVRHLNDRQVIAYATVSPDGIQANGSDSIVRTAWNLLRGQQGPYYLVRASAPASDGNATATRLLSIVLVGLSQEARAAVR